MTDCFGASIVNMSNTASSQLIIVSLHCTKHPLATCRTTNCNVLRLLDMTNSETNREACPRVSVSREGYLVLSLACLVGLSVKV